MASHLLKITQNYMCTLYVTSSWSQLECFNVTWGNREQIQYTVSSLLVSQHCSIHINNTTVITLL